MLAKAFDPVTFAHVIAVSIDSPARPDTVDWVPQAIVFVKCCMKLKNPA